jgi:MFS family permease
MFIKDNPSPGSDTTSLIRRLMIFIALVNVAEGLGQTSGIINQPLVHFLKDFLGWAPDQVTKFIAVLIIPWVIKPLYGLISDFLPVFGYRRKPYIILANLLTVGGMLWMTGLLQATPIMIALFINAFGMAASSTITEAVMVENGNNLGTAGKFLNQQWLWYNIAAIIASLGGGWLAQHLPATSAFHKAALIACVAPLVVAALTWWIIGEQRNAVKPTKAPALPQHGLPPILKSRTLWVTALFLFIWNIVPSFGTPLYYHMSDDLKFSQGLIGILSAVASVGSVIGGVAYTFLARKINLTKLLYLSLALTTISQFSYLALHDPVSAIAINFVAGLFGMIALVSSLTVAAHAAPQKAAGFVFALLMSVNNLSGQLSNNLGAWLFVHRFHNHLDPVIIIAGVATAACALFVPMLRLGDQRGDHFMPTRVPSAGELMRSVLKRVPNSSASGL